MTSLTFEHASHKTSNILHFVTWTTFKMHGICRHTYPFHIGFPIISFIASKTLDRFTSRLSKSPIEIDSLCIIPTARVYKWVDFPIKWYRSCDDCCDSTSKSSSSQLFMYSSPLCTHAWYEKRKIIQNKDASWYVYGFFPTLL